LNEQGTGIGLNIVKSHLENLGGNIYFKSKENKGSVFTFELPLIYEK
ncbi:MAG: HAMP domain-containing histidine kinase, partial [Bacteroidetes bacterium]|nr:HAMP domain-containing histidine kinase [Bacteroidota bacterium]